MIPKWLRLDQKTIDFVERISSKLASGNSEFNSKAKHAFLESIFWTQVESETHQRFLNELSITVKAISEGRSDSILQSLFWIRLSGLLFESLADAEGHVSDLELKIKKMKKVENENPMIVMHKKFQERISFMRKIMDSFSEDERLMLLYMRDRNAHYYLNGYQYTMDKTNRISDSRKLFGKIEDKSKLGERIVKVRDRFRSGDKIEMFALSKYYADKVLPHIDDLIKIWFV